MLDSFDNMENLNVGRYQKNSMSHPPLVTLGRPNMNTGHIYYPPNVRPQYATAQHQGKLGPTQRHARARISSDHNWQIQTAMAKYMIRDPPQSHSGNFPNSHSGYSSQSHSGYSSQSHSGNSPQFQSGHSPQFHFGNSPQSHSGDLEFHTLDNRRREVGSEGITKTGRMRRSQSIPDFLQHSALGPEFVGRSPEFTGKSVPVEILNSKTTREKNPIIRKATGNEPVYRGERITIQVPAYDLETDDVSVDSSLLNNIYAGIRPEVAQLGNMGQLVKHKYLSEQVLTQRQEHGSSQFGTTQRAPSQERYRAQRSLDSGQGAGTYMSRDIHASRDTVQRSHSIQGT